MGLRGPQQKFTEQELQKKVDQYFDEEKQPTMGGLAVHLGISRKNLLEYNNRDRTGYIIKNARSRIEAIYEQRLIYKGNPAGVIFALKNLGKGKDPDAQSWTDKQEIESDNTLKITIESDNNKLKDL